MKIIALATVFILLAPAMAYSEEQVTSSPVQATNEQLREFEDILKTDPENVRALNGKAGILMLMGQVAEAEPLVEKVLQIEPEHLNALNNKGVIIIQLYDDYDGALEIFEFVAESDPENLQALFNIANVMKIRGEFEQCLDALDEILLLDSDNQRAVAEKSELLRLYPETRMDGHVQMVVRNSYGQLVAYLETDVINRKNIDGNVQAILDFATSAEEVVLDGERYYNAKTYSSVDMNQDQSIMRTGTTLVSSSTYPQNEPINYNLITARTHGYLVEPGDTTDSFFQLIVPRA